MSKAVELTVHGQRCRVVTSASEQELKVLAQMVEAKLDAILKPGRPVSTQAMLLAAVALANDVVEERQRAQAIADKASSALDHLLHQVDEALAIQDAATVIKQGKRSAAKRRQRSGAMRPAATAAPSQQDTSKRLGTNPGTSRQNASSGTSRQSVKPTSMQQSELGQQSKHRHQGEHSDDS